jgi:hypothetical protein
VWETEVGAQSAIACSVAGSIRRKGSDEIDLNRNYISWVSPLGRALMKSAAGDSAVLQSPGGTEYRTVLEVFFKRISVEPLREPPGSEASAKGLTRPTIPLTTKETKRHRW